MATANHHRFYTADAFPVDGSIGFLLTQVRASLKRQIDGEMARNGLTDAQWAPLFMIHLRRNVTAAELSQKLDVDAGALTRTLDRLEGKGLLRRVRSTVDRRQIHLVLTPAGERAVSHVPAALAAANNAHLDGFTPDEFKMLHDLLLRMLENGRRLADDGKSAATLPAQRAVA